MAQVFIKCSTRFLVCQDILVDGFMMELDNPLFFQPAGDLFRTPILLNIVLDELFDFIRELDGLRLLFMTLFGQTSIGLLVPVAPLSCIAAYLSRKTCFGNVPAPLQFGSSKCPLCAQSRYNVFRQDLGVYSSFVASVNSLVTVYLAPKSCLSL